VTGNEKLIRKIKDTIRKKGAISFCQFMEMALYDPEEGYYMASHKQFGEGGDFATSTEFHPLFGKMVAKQLAQMLGGFPQGIPLSLVEMGAGKGDLGELILQFFEEHYPHLYERIIYEVVERSPALRACQGKRLRDYEQKGKVAWFENLKALKNPRRGCLFSNELVDSFPVHRVQIIKGEIKEIFVTIEKGQWVESLLPPSTPALENYFKRLGIHLAEGAIAEVNLKAMDWMKEVGELLDSGYVMTVDYGYPAKQLYVPGRRKGTLMCYYRHGVEENPYTRIGLQDITSHVDFSSLVLEGKKAELEVLGFTDQLSFLMGLGISQEMEAMVKEKGPETLEFQRAKALLLPERMGKVFKVLILGKKQPVINLDGLAFRPFISGVLEI
jgi:SAM-dependent MidA family methyltransferase